MQTDCKKERYQDKAAFAVFVSELRAEFAPRGLLLSAAVSPRCRRVYVDSRYYEQ